MIPFVQVMNVLSGQSRFVRLTRKRMLSFETSLLQKTTLCRKRLQLQLQLQLQLNPNLNLNLNLQLQLQLNPNLCVT